MAAMYTGTVDSMYCQALDVEFLRLNSGVAYMFPKEVHFKEIKETEDIRRGR
jgi:hypothetical protein